MDVISFDIVVRPVDEHRLSEGTLGDVVILINGSPLLDLVREHERAEASRHGQDGPAGSYLPRSVRRAPRGLLYAQPASDYEHGDGRFILMGCICGEIDCWPLVARIHVDDNGVVWNDFEH